MEDLFGTYGGLKDVYLPLNHYTRCVHAKFVHLPCAAAQYLHIWRPKLLYAAGVGAHTYSMVRAVFHVIFSFVMW